MQTSLQGGDILSWDLKTEEQPKGQVQEKISGKKLENKPIKLGAGEKGRSDEVNGQGQLLLSTQEPPGVTN